MAMDDQVARLLRLAFRDFRAMEAMAGDASTFPDEILGFHAQQAVEKAAKAWLSFRGTEYPRTHDLDLLFELIADTGASIPAEFDELRDLVDFSVQYRYEAFDDVPIDRESTIRLVSRFLAHVTGALADVE